MSSSSTYRSWLLLGLICLSLSSWAQSITVKGKVIDAVSQFPLSGVQVSTFENTTCLTDLEGNFNLEVEMGEQLSFAFMSYHEHTQKVDGASMLVSLGKVAGVPDELIVTALGEKRSRKSLGYAVGVINGLEIAASTTVSPVEAMTGKVAGLEISATDGGTFGGFKMELRGVSNLLVNNRPIFVVDGVILDNPASLVSDADFNASGGDWGGMLKNLNPDDFESISVLKGPASSALYGIRGMNGAIIITTKSGKTKEGFKINVNQTLAVDKVYRSGIDLQTVYGPGNYFGNRQGYAGSPYADELGKSFVDGTEYYSIPATSTHRMFGPKYDASMKVENWDGELAPYQAYEDGLANAYEMGIRNNTYVSLQGGNERGAYYSSISYNKTTGVSKGNDFDRLSIMVKASQKFSDWMKGAFSFNYVQSNPQNPAQN